MKLSTIAVATLLSALTLPVFAQTGATTAAPKTETAAKHKTVKHTAKKEKAEKTEKVSAASTDTAAAKSK